jgi:branched-chain amino acid aminotransferase
MPAVPNEIFIRAVELLVECDRDWIPGAEGALYLRPFMFASATFLSFKPSPEYIFCVIA